MSRILSVQDPVVLAGVVDQPGIDLHRLQHPVELEALNYGDALVTLPVKNQGRCLDLFDMSNGIVSVHSFPLAPRRPALRSLATLRNVSGVHSREVDHTGVANCAAETSCERQQPCDEVSTVRSTGDGHPVWIDEAEFEDLIGGGENVLGRLVSPATLNAGREVLAEWSSTGPNGGQSRPIQE